MKIGFSADKLAIVTEDLEEAKRILEVLDTNAFAVIRDVQIQKVDDVVVTITVSGKFTRFYGGEEGKDGGGKRDRAGASKAHGED